MTRVLVVDEGVLYDALLVVPGPAQGYSLGIPIRLPVKPDLSRYLSLAEAEAQTQIVPEVVEISVVLYDPARDTGVFRITSDDYGRKRVVMEHWRPVNW